MKTKIFTFAIVSWILHSTSLQAAPGSLDTTFGGTGKVKTGFGGGYAIAYAVTVQADGKLILAGYGNGRDTQTYGYALGGDFLIARFNTNNVLDVSFGDGGKVLTQVSTNYHFRSDASAIKAVKVQADGKIVAAGYSYQNTNYASFTLARYNLDGSLDTTFGTNGTGIVSTDFGQYSQANAMVIQSDSNIVVVGFISDDGYNHLGVAMARYSINGQLDASFGSGGKVTTSGSEYGANAIMLQSDSKIVAVGTGEASGDSGSEFAMFRYTTNGVLDSTFGGGTGKVFTRISPINFDYSGSANAVTTQFGNGTIQNPDRIVVAGTYDNEHASPDEYFQAVLRYNLDGTLDTTFGNNGIVTNAIIPQYPFGQFCTGLNVQGFLNQPRKITICGWGTDGTNRYYSLARFTSAGVLDTTFGTNSSGKILLPVGRFTDQEAAANAMVLQSFQFVLAGDVGFSSSEFDFAAARFTSSGLIDTTFGSNGVLTANISDAPGAQASAVTIQPDGKIVAAGSTPPFYVSLQNREEQRFAVARYNSDGSLDNSFGVAGKQTTTIGSNDLAYAVAVQQDGKIVAAGKSNYSGNDRFALVRYNSDGSPDTSFGNNGTTTTLVGGGSGQANSVRIQTDGKILTAGYASSGNNHFALARFNTNGTLDASFGSAGTVITSISTVDLAYSAGFQSDGKIVACGLTAQINGSTVTSDFAAARYNTNGALDFSFGSLGRTTANVGSGTLDVGYALAIQPDGKIILAGGAGLGNLPGPSSGNTSVNAFLALMRFNTNGTPDSSFGSGGSVITQVGAYSDFATSIALQSDGKIVVAGASQNGFYKMFALRYNINGTVDGSYGIGGTALVDFGSGTNEYAYGLALDSSGRAVLAGDAGGWFGLARLEGDFVASPSLKIFLTSTNTAVVSWPYPSAGWNLQQNTNLSAASWSAPGQTINNDGTNNFIVVTPVSGNCFYRLSKP